MPLLHLSQQSQCLHFIMPVCSPIVYFQQIITSQLNIKRQWLLRAIKMKCLRYNCFVLLRDGPTDYLNSWLLARQLQQNFTSKMQSCHFDLAQFIIINMIINTVKKGFRCALKGLSHKQQCGVLDHHKMEELKKKLFTDREKTLLLKAKFILKQAKFTIVQGSKDLWNDTKWLVKLYKTKQYYEFTGFELAQSQRIKIDMIKFIPYSVILVVPFAQLSLPIILWLYPNAVPSFYLFDTAEDQRIQRYENIQFESHKFFIDKLTQVMSERLKIEPYQFSKYQFFKEGFFQVIDDLDKHLDYNTFNSNQLIKVLQFLGGGDFITGTETLNKIVNLFTLNIPRLILKTCRWVYSRLTNSQLQPYRDPFFVRGNFAFLKLDYLPFQFLKRRFLLWQISRKFKMIWYQDRAFEKYGLDDIIGSDVKNIARQRGLATLSCYEALKGVIKNDWVKFTTHPKFKNNNIKLWYSVMMYNFLKDASRDIN